MAAFHVLRVRDFRHYIIARMLVNFSISMMGRVVSWQVYDMTHDKYYLGLIGLAEFVPYFCISFFAGHFADIFDRKKIAQLCIVLFSLCGLSLYLLSTHLSSVLLNHGIVPIFMVIFFTGLIRGQLSPAQSSFASQLIPKEDYVSGATWSNVAWHVASIGGPAIGGLLYSISKGPSISYMASTVLTAVGFCFFFSIGTRHVESEQGEKESVFESIHNGFRFVFGNQVLVGALALDMFAVLFGGAVAMIPAYADEVLHLDPLGYGRGFLSAAPALGALVMSAIVAFYPPRKGAGTILLLAVGGFGVCTLFFAVSQSFWFSMLMLAGTGFFDNVSMVVRGTIVPLFTPNEMRGRVSSVNGIFIGSSNELGAYESGLAAKYMGLVPSVVFGGVMTLLVVGVAWWKAPKLKGLDL